MKKLCLLSAFAILTILIGLYFNISDIKFAEASTGRMREYSEYINVSGEFENLKATEIAFSFPVYIDKIYVSESRYVSKGQLLFSIDKKKMLSVAGNIYNSGISEMLGTEYSVPEDNTYINNMLEKIPDKVYAPENGYIKNINISQGQLCAPNTCLVSIEGEHDIMARFTVLQPDFGKISVGDKVQIYPVAFSTKNYSGIISEKNAVVKKQSSVTGNKVVIDVFACIENPDTLVSDGLQINGKIESGHPQTVYSVEHSYVHQDDEGEYVFILDKGTARKIYIETGVETEDFIQIITPFEEKTVFLKGEIENGDRVVIAG